MGQSRTGEKLSKFIVWSCHYYLLRKVTIGGLILNPEQALFRILWLNFNSRWVPVSLRRYYFTLECEKTSKVELCSWEPSLSSHHCWLHSFFTPSSSKTKWIDILVASCLHIWFWSSVLLLTFCRMLCYLVCPLLAGCCTRNSSHF